MSTNSRENTSIGLYVHVQKWKQEWRDSFLGCAAVIDELDIHYRIVLCNWPKCMWLYKLIHVVQAVLFPYWVQPEIKVSPSPIYLNDLDYILQPHITPQLPWFVISYLLLSIMNSLSFFIGWMWRMNRRMFICFYVVWVSKVVHPDYYHEGHHFIWWRCKVLDVCVL